MVSDAHVDLLATAYVALVDQSAEPQRVGQRMLRDNAISVATRYPCDREWIVECQEQAEAYRYQRWNGELNLALVSKQIACLDYQSCEFDGWGSSLSRRYLDALEWHCPKQDAIPTEVYDRLPWGIDGHGQAAEAA